VDEEVRSITARPAPFVAVSVPERPGAANAGEIPLFGDSAVKPEGKAVRGAPNPGWPLCSERP
jgi:hypothetical protein